MLLNFQDSDATVKSVQIGHRIGLKEKPLVFALESGVPNGI
jgi:hypothetical protein